MLLALLRTSHIPLKVDARVLDFAAVIARDERVAFPVQADRNDAVAVSGGGDAGLGDDVALVVGGVMELLLVVLGAIYASPCSMNGRS